MLNIFVIGLTRATGRKGERGNSASRDPVNTSFANLNGRPEKKKQRWIDENPCSRALITIQSFNTSIQETLTSPIHHRTSRDPPRLIRRVPPELGRSWSPLVDRKAAVLPPIVTAFSS